MNRFINGREPPDVPAPDYSALEQEQIARIQRARAHRDERAAVRALDMLRTSAACYAQTNEAPLRISPRLMPLILDAVRRRATVGEIAGALASVWGRYRPT